MIKYGVKTVNLQILFCAALLFTARGLIYAEPSVGSFALEAKNVSEQVNAAVTNAIFNFVKEQKKYKIIDLRPKTSDEDSGEFNYIFMGTLTGGDEGIELKLILKSTADNVTRTIAKIYQNANLILLDSRVLVADLFDMSVNLHAYEQANTSRYDNNAEDDFRQVTGIDALSGSWHGEDGIERIEVMRGGRAIAVLSGGTSIFLHLKISEGYLIVTQAGTPTIRQFANLPDEIAKKAAALGKTPTWKFLVSANNKILSGEKTDIEIIYSGDSITSTQDITKKVKWFKQ